MPHIYVVVPGWLFDAQVISFTSQNRDACIDLMITAIRRAIEYCRTHDTLTPSVVEAKECAPEGTEEKADVHDSDAAQVDGLETQLKKAVVAAFGSARAAFDTHSKNDAVGKKEWKKLIKKALPSLNQEVAKLLRKRLPNRMSWVDFGAFIGGESASTAGKGNTQSKTYKDEPAPSGMAVLPPEVPEVSCC